MSQPNDVSQMVNELAIQLLYDNIAALPHEEYGVINMLPFAHDTETTRTVKRQVCEAVVQLFDSAGYLKNELPQSEPLPTHRVIVACAACHNELVSIITDDAGNSNVVGALFVSTIAKLNTDCPHNVVTIDDMRQKMQREFMALDNEEDNGQ